MGLDTTHDCWHGAYSAFHRWRTEIARVAGIPLDLMEFFYEGQLRECAEHGSPPPYIVNKLLEFDKLLPLKWTALKPDVLHELLHHSDCDGEIAAELCAPIADRLDALLPLLRGDGGGHIGSYREKTQQFIDGLRLAASLNENVEFR